jgi:hypothetical protein
MTDKTLHVSEGKFFKLLDDLAKGAQPNEVRAPVKVHPRVHGQKIRVEISEYAYKRLLEVDLTERYA